MEKLLWFWGYLSLSLSAPVAATSDVVSRVGLWSECDDGEDDDGGYFFTRLNAVEVNPRYPPLRCSVIPSISLGSLEYWNLINRDTQGNLRLWMW